MSSAWKKWSPGLKNGDKTLREVYDTLPGNTQEEISMLVRVFENPASPIAFKGAVSLKRHDCIHILLGRGLLNQDEAFVIGYTMGTSGDISRLEQFLFETVSSRLYPQKYRFNKRHLVAYRLGLALGKQSDIKKIYAYPIEEAMDDTLLDLRQRLGIDVDTLKAVFKEEQQQLPHSIASKRLDI